MGVVGSKSPLERRNSVLRRSQRRSIHGVKSKADRIAKDIKKFKGTEENTEYIELKARIESAERELRVHLKTLQAQIRPIYQEALRKTLECHKLLDEKLKLNQDKLREKLEKEAAQEKKEEKVEEKDDDDDVFVEEINEERQLEESPEKRKTVQLNFIQVEPIEQSPQINKRFSAMKIGVPVMPESMLESFHRMTEDLNFKFGKRIGEIRREIEALEIEINQFVGRKNGKYYNKIKNQLESYASEVKGIVTADDDIQEQAKLCSQYVDSCLSFLDEKAVDDDVDGDDDDDEDTMTNTTEQTAADRVPTVENNLSPRSIRTTYI